MRRALGPSPGQNKQKAVVTTPENKVHRRTMPKPPKQHGKKEIHAGAESTLSITAQRNIKVVPQPARKGYMPTGPEFADILRQIRSIEIIRDVIAKNLRRTDRDIAVPGEIVVDLKAVSIQRKK